MEKAYSRLKIKTLDEEQRIIRGIATTPTRDRQLDIIEPLGVRFAESVPLLIAHDHTRAVGRVTFQGPTAAGVEFVAKIAKVDEPGPLRDRVETAWGEVRHGICTDVSVGFRPIDGQVEPLPNGGLRFKEIELFELSLVAVPANPEARILEVRRAGDARKASSAIRHRTVRLDGKWREEWARKTAAKLRANGVKVPFFLNADAFEGWLDRREAEAKAKGTIFVGRHSR